MSVASADQVRDTLLQDSSYHIEFNSYLTNHVKHVIVALHGLKAPPETIQRYWDEYTAVTPNGFHLEPVRAQISALSKAEYNQILGRKERYPDLLQYFDSQVQEHGMDAVLAEHMPRLIQGAAAALTHGIIHLGWGLDAASRWMTIEGLAYMAYTYLDVHPDRFTPAVHADTTPLDTLLRVAAAYHDGSKAEVHAIMHDPQYDTDFHPELYDAGFQWQLAKVLEHGHAVFLELPAWLEEAPVEDALREMYKAVTLLYITLTGAPGKRKAGYVVALHLITSLWGAEQVMQRLPEDQHRGALRCFWASAVAVVASSGAGFPTPDALRTAWDAYGSATDPEDTSGRQNAAEGLRAWPEIVERAYGEEEEHNIKLVYVCQELWRRYGRWHAFRVAADPVIDTPNVGPGKAANKS